MQRRQMPLAPLTVNTHFGLQGQTARNGLVAWSCGTVAYAYRNVAWKLLFGPVCNAVQTYSYGHLLLLGCPAREVFESGLKALPVLQRRIFHYENAAEADRKRADDIIEKQLGWLSVSSY